MAWNDPTETLGMRIRVLVVVMLAALCFLGVVLWRIQVLSSGSYLTSLDRQSMRRVRLPGVRGRILDRNGVCLADNRPSYGVAVYVEELRRPGPWKNTVDAVEEAIARLSDLLGVPAEVTRADIERHVNKRLALPFLAWRDISDTVLSRWAENSADLSGVDITIEPVRVYPRGALAAHVLGYVGRSDPRQDLDEPFDFYLADMEGVRGIEAGMNHVLTGVPGGRLIRVDASGFKHERVGERPAESGHDVVLALDARVQELAETALGDREGAIVVLDPRNGDVLGMASSPSFDPNVFSPSVSRAQWNALTQDKGQPLVNRAIAEIYPPGSTFKPMVALAALDSGRATADTTFDCPGYFALGGTRFLCWRTSGHGSLALVEAIEQSCNSYFCQLGMRCGHEQILRAAKAAGFGRATGIDLAGEVDGILPSNQWKMERFRDAWRPGDTCNLSIGQGFLAVTPLQMAVFTAAIANGGRLLRPRLVMSGQGDDGEVVNTIKWRAEALGAVRQGMYDVINAPRGTGKRARVEGVEMAGKTGTAEIGPRGDRRKHAWMLAYAPFDAPRYALAMIVEEAVSGGTTVAPRIHKLVAGLFGVPVDDEEGEAGT